jgi:5-methylcytosine-specific restriction enzyme subunit McrC
MKPTIPIQNLFYLLLYAWDVLEESEAVEIDAAECTQLVDLFARVLHRATEHILRRGLDRGYLALRSELPGIRGKVDISASVKAGAFSKGKAVCEFDEFTHDVLHNRILKSTIRRMLLVPDLDESLREELGQTFQRLHQIAEIALSDAAFRSVQLNRNNREYRLPMEVCRIIHNSQLIEDSPGEVRFMDFFRDERRMRVLFETFVRNFYRRETRGTAFRVCRNRLEWARTRGSAAAMQRLPFMRTDVRLRSRRRTILVETKFVPRMYQTYFGRETLRSNHLYQLFAYLVNLGDHEAGRRSLEAILLYPTVSASCDLEYEMFGYRVRVFALDLNRRWQFVHDDLLRLLAEP